MVRLDKCVEALYDSVTADSRNKNLQILTVMKGAISMSKSKTGECIFRTNKTERKNLERLLKIEGRNANYTISQIDTHRKHVMSHWSKVLENKATCSSQALLEELLEIEDVPDTSKKDSKVISDSPEPEDFKLKTLVDLRLAKLESENNTSGFTSVMASRRRQTNYQQIEKDRENHDKQPETEFITEHKQIRSKYAGGGTSKQEPAAPGTDHHVVKLHGTGLAKTKSSQLPAIHREGVGHAAHKGAQSGEDAPPPLERDLTDWGNWSLKDKSWIKGYLNREKTRHEDLIIRNALNRIETEMSGANAIKRQQMLQKLQNERQQREAEVRRSRERAKREAETPMSHTVAVASSENLNNSIENMAVTCKTPTVIKRVAFKEPLVVSESTERMPRTSVGQTAKSKRRYKPMHTSVNHLPLIKEGRQILKVTQIG